MVSAVGGVGGWQSGTGSVGADHELAQLKKKLSECVNCESAATPQGRAEITEISTRITAIKDHQRTANDAAPPEPGAAARPSGGPLGTRLDVYA